MLGFNKRTTPELLRILCFGDSNTWGYDPKTRKRYPGDIRWPGVMTAALNNKFDVIEEGLCGRTTVWDDPVEGGAIRNGLKYLPACLESHKPLSLVIVLLGTNDLKYRFNLSARDIAESAGQLVKCIKTSHTGHAGKAPPVLLLAPPPIARLKQFSDTFKEAREKSEEFGRQFESIANLHGCHFLDCGSHIQSSDVDGIHLDPRQQKKLGRVVAQKVTGLL